MTSSSVWVFFVTGNAYGRKATECDGVSCYDLSIAEISGLVLVLQGYKLCPTDTVKALAFLTMFHIPTLRGSFSASSLQNADAITFELSSVLKPATRKISHIDPDF